MNTIATTGSQALKVSQSFPQLKVRIELLQSMEVKEALDVLAHPAVRLVYDEKSCGFTPVAFNHTDTGCLKTLEAAIHLENASLHGGQFGPANTFEVRSEGELLGTATVVEVLEPGFVYWDWKTRPQSYEPYALPFTTDQLECFLLHLEFDLLELPFLSDYSIRRARTDDYALDIRLMTSSGSLQHQQALMIVQALERQPGEYCCIKPGFYQLAAAGRLENFECHFIFGSAGRSVTGRLIVL